MSVTEFPDIELWAAGYLRTLLAANGYPGVFVSNRRESQATAVWVRRDGGGVVDVAREQPRLAVNVFAPSEQAVTNLARRVSTVMRAAKNNGPVRDVTQASSFPVAAEDGQPRQHYMLFELTVVGSPVTLA